MAACFRLSWKACILGMALVALFCPKVSAKDAVIKSPRVVTLFEPEEKEYDRYAAAISAIEPLRVERDQRVEETLNPFFFCWMKARWGGGSGLYARLLELAPEEAPPGAGPGLRRAQAACNAYLVKSSRVIQSLDLDVGRFNALSREVQASRDLKRRVTQQARLYRSAWVTPPRALHVDTVGGQAYLYRVASELHDGERFPAFDAAYPPRPGAGAAAAGAAAAGAAGAGAAVGAAGAGAGAVGAAAAGAAGAVAARGRTQSATARRFALTLARVEAERTRQLGALGAALGLPRGAPVPPHMADPAAAHLLSDRLGAIVAGYADKADKLIREGGFSREEFHSLRDRSHKDLFFRWQVNRALETISKKKQ